MINRDNYEEIMFGMIEGLYSEAERHQLLQQIAADPFLTTEWSHWCGTQLEDDLSDYTPAAANWATAYLANKKLRPNPVLHYARWTGRIAAAIALLFGCWYFLHEPPSLPAGSHQLTSQDHVSVAQRPPHATAVPSPTTGRLAHDPMVVPAASNHTDTEKAVSAADIPDKEQQIPHPADDSPLPAGEATATEPRLPTEAESAQPTATPIFTVSIHTEVINDYTPATSRNKGQARDLLTNSRLRLTTDQIDGGLQLRLQGANHANLQIPLQKEVHHQ